MRRTTLLTGIVFILFACSNGRIYQEAPFNGSKVIIDANMLKEGIPVFILSDTMAGILIILL